MPEKASLDLSLLESRLREVYSGDESSQQASRAFELIKDAIERSGFNLEAAPPDTPERWSQRDVVLITYGDQVRSNESNPLQTLRRFLHDQGVRGLINTVHFLPCFPYSSDDGFSVIDYLQIDPDLGSWDDVADYRQDYDLMLDFVVNHISQHSQWFKEYLQGNSPYDQFFIEADPADDLSGVTRPRSLPLLSDFETNRGKRWLWTTFSRDQVDLNYADPRLLAEVIYILLEYARRGARIIRLDAIAYLWKQIGTTCIHLPETHAVVKLFRDVLERVAPQVLVLTETNVPHAENVSYFGDGDEAHMVYQFSLPPLLLDAFLNDDAVPLKNWMSKLEGPPPGATYFNFTASHDGVGVRPLEGNVSSERLASLVEKVGARDGLIGTKRNADGTDSPYELNVSYVDALAPDQPDNDLHARRFLASQAVMLAMQGVPAIYFHSLVGTQNYLEGVEESSIPRRINRRKFQLDELNARVGEVGSLQHTIFAGVKRLLQARVSQPAFHPDASQTYVESGLPGVLCFERHCATSGQVILVVANFDDTEQQLELPDRFVGGTDLLADSTATDHLQLKPAQVAWLEAKN